jgi:hypothetical protein
MKKQIKRFLNFINSGSIEEPPLPVDNSSTHTISIHFYMDKVPHIYSRSYVSDGAEDHAATIKRLNQEITDIYNQMQKHESAFILVPSGFVLRKTDFISAERLLSKR